jgi:hypothetical protein
VRVLPCEVFTASTAFISDCNVEMLDSAEVTSPSIVDIEEVCDVIVPSAEVTRVVNADVAEALIRI